MTQPEVVSDAQLDDPTVTKRADSACAAGAVFEVIVDQQGLPLSLNKAYPHAPKWVRRLADLFAGER